MSPLNIIPYINPNNQGCFFQCSNRFLNIPNDTWWIPSHLVSIAAAPGLSHRQLESRMKLRPLQHVHWGESHLRLVERQNHMKTCRKKTYQCNSLKTSWNRWYGWCCRNCTSWGRCDENQIPMFTFSFLLSKRRPKGGDLSRHPKGGDFNLKPSTVPHQQSCAKPLTERDSAIGSPSAFWPRPSSVGWGGKHASLSLEFAVFFSQGTVKDQQRPKNKLT